MPALTQFVDGTGPIFAGKVFPFVFITIACGALSGFHALVSCGTTPKLVANEGDIRLAGYGSMAVESFVAIMAVIAATLLDPGVYFAINTGAGIVGTTAEAAVRTISDWGFPVTAAQMHALAQDMGEKTLFARTGGAPSLAVGMASIFASAFGKGLLALWYHFAIMFEAIFILTTVDAGTRVGRFMLQDAMGQIWKPMGADLLVSLGDALQHADRRRLGLLPLRRRRRPQRRHQHPLAAVRHRQPDAGRDRAVAWPRASWSRPQSLRYVWVTALPLAWITVVTTVAAWQKIFSTDIKLGFFAAANDMAEKLAAGTLPAGPRQGRPDADLQPAAGRLADCLLHAAAVDRAAGDDPRQRPPACAACPCRPTPRRRTTATKLEPAPPRRSALMKQFLSAGLSLPAGRDGRRCVREVPRASRTHPPRPAAGKPGGVLQGAARAEVELRQRLLLTPARTAAPVKPSAPGSARRRSTAPAHAGC